MKLMQAFDPNAHTLPNSRDIFPESGYYPVVVSKAELQATKNNQANWMLVLTLQAIDGAHKGRTTSLNLNIINSNPDAVRIAYSELAAYSTAMGINQAFDDTNVLLNRPFGVTVQVSDEPSNKDPNKTYKQNKVTSWHYADGTEIKQGHFGAASVQQAAPSYAAPAAPAPVAAPVAPVAPAAPAAPAAPVAAAPVAAPAVAAPVMPAAAPAAPAAPVAPAAGAPAFAPPAGVPPFPQG